VRAGDGGFGGPAGSQARVQPSWWRTRPRLSSRRRLSAAARVWSQALFLVTPPVADLAVPAGDEPGDGPFDHRPVVLVGRLPLLVVRALPMLALQRVVGCRCSERPSLAVVHRAARGQPRHAAPEVTDRRGLISRYLGEQWCHDCNRPCQRLGMVAPARAARKSSSSRNLTGDQVDDPPSKNLPLQDSPATMKKSPRFQGKLISPAPLQAADGRRGSAAMEGRWAGLWTTRFSPDDCCPSRPFSTTSGRAAGRGHLTCRICPGLLLNAEAAAARSGPTWTHCRSWPDPGLLAALEA